MCFPYIWRRFHLDVYVYDSPYKCIICIEWLHYEKRASLGINKSYFYFRFMRFEYTTLAKLWWSQGDDLFKQEWHEDPWQLRWHTVWSC